MPAGARLQKGARVEILSKHKISCEIKYEKNHSPSILTFVQSFSCMTV